jgi:phospholipid/cholesterol/gamma-HCH transport system ATP-binding protein
VGLIRPDSGSIKINGVEVTNLNEKEYNRLRMEIGMVFQGGALFDSMNVGENVGFVLNEFMNLDKKTVKDRVRDALGLVGLKDVEAYDAFPAFRRDEKAGQFGARAVHGAAYYFV